MKHPMRPILFCGLGLAAAAILPLLPRDEAAPRLLPPPVDAVAAGAAAAAAPPAPRRQEAPRAIYDLRPGQRLQIDCDLELASTVAQGRAPAQQLSARLAGSMHLLVLARSEQDLVLQAAMPTADVAGADATAAALLREDLARPWLVRLSPRGAILGYRFATEFQGGHRNHVRSLFAALRATVAAADQRQWSAVEADATGSAEVQYEWGEVLQRHKLGYRAGGAAPRPTVEGSGWLVADPDSGWWQHACLDETYHLDAEEADFHLQMHVRMRAQLATSEQLPMASLPTFDAELPWSPASGAGESTDAGDAEALLYRDALRGATAASVVEQMAALLARQAPDIELYDARRQLVLLLRRDGTAAAQLRDLLAGSPPALVAEMLGAAGAADTAATQALLASLLGERGEPAATRLAAMRALFQAATPTGALAQATTSVLEDPTQSPELHGTALLLLGAFAGRSDSDAALQSLLDRETFAVDRGLVADWLAALGNAGRPAVADAALRHQDDADPGIRAAALVALRRVDDARVLPALEAALRRDADEQVRLAAVQVVAERRDREAVRRLLVLAAEGDASPQVRQVAAAALAR